MCDELWIDDDDLDLWILWDFIFDTIYTKTHSSLI